MRCVCCNAPIVYEWGMGTDSDLCSACTDSVRRALKDDNFIRKEYMHAHARNGVTQPRKTDYEK